MEETCRPGSSHGNQMEADAQIGVHEIKVVKISPAE
jgi:hypothetical protein